MASRRDFLSAIRDSLDESTLRLVFADWLDEQGDSERALFVREQLALADTLSSPEALALSARMWARLFRHADRWIGDDLGDPRHGLSVAEATFRRGVLSGLMLSEGQFQRCGPRWLAHAPITALKLVGQIGVPRLAANPALAGLTTLDLGNCEVGDRELSALARSPYVGAITTLSLSRCPVGLDGVRTLLSADSGFTALRVLDLGGCPIADEDFVRLDRSQPYAVLCRGTARTDCWVRPPLASGGDQLPADTMTADRIGPAVRSGADAPLAPEPSGDASDRASRGR